jgi:hypothetical protein
MSEPGETSKPVYREITCVALATRMKWFERSQAARVSRRYGRWAESPSAAATPAGQGDK